jgi:hypothetical protein
MLRVSLRSLLVAGLILLAFGAHPSRAAAQSQLPSLTIEGLGKGTTPLDGPWEFHLGDNPAWAMPQATDTGWEQITADTTWGAQDHPAYTGYAWYRKHVHITVAPGADPNLALFIGHIDDAYEIYWNGARVATYGKMPPSPLYYYVVPPATFGLGPVRDGVLAFRVWKAPLSSFDSDQLGGFAAAPILGSPTAIAEHKALTDYTWLRTRQYYFAMRAVYVLVMIFSFIGWLRDRSQRVLLAMAAFGASAVAAMFLTGLRLPLPFTFAIGWLQPVLSAADISLWYLLLYLLKLSDVPRIARFTYWLSVISFAATSLDGLLSAADWTSPFFASWVQGADGILTAIFTVSEMFPLVLVAFALRKRLDSARWFLAIAACIDGMLSVVRIAVQQGSRFTHWTIGNKIGAPLFTINGNVLNAQTLADTLLLIAIIYAVSHYVRESARRHSSLEQEFKSASELQRVLIPEALPNLPGFAFTSSYRPAQEVGGDFFQVIPLEGEHAGSTLVLLGDVSGKGLKAAMTVSLIVGAARALAKFAPQPGQLLAELNERLYGRMQNGFVTCMALCLRDDGTCVMASAGHPAPYLNRKEVKLPGALPLGVVASVAYEETTIRLREGDHFALYTDGLLEARSATGEIFSFDRLDALFSSQPDALRATEAAVDFGQEDDITVLMLTRLVAGEKSSSQLIAPSLARA